MKSNFKLALAGIGLLGAIAAVLWLVRQPPSPTPIPTPAPSPVPQPTPLPEAPSPVAAPEAPSPVEAPAAPSPGDAALAFGNDLVIKTIADAPKVLQLAIENAGGQKALQEAERATYEHFLAGAVSSGGKLWIDGGKALLAQEDDIPGKTWLTVPAKGTPEDISSGACLHQRDGVVAPCPQRLQQWYTIQRHLHAATVLVPLGKAPYELTSANAGPFEGRLLNVLRYRVGEDELVLYLDVKGQKPVRVEYSPKEGYRMSARVDLDDIRSFGQVKVPAMRRIALQVGEKAFQTLTDRVVDLRPGVEAVSLSPPPPTPPGPLPQVTRPPLPAVAVDVGTHETFGSKTGQVAELLGAEGQAMGALLLEALSPEGKDEGVVLWLVPRQAAGLGEAARNRLKTLPGGTVAQTLARVAVGQVPAVAQKAAAAVANRDEGPVIVRYCSDPDRTTKEVTVLVQVPVK